MSSGRKKEEGEEEGVEEGWGGWWGESEGRKTT